MNVLRGLKLLRIKSLFTQMKSTFVDQNVKPKIILFCPFRKNFSLYRVLMPHWRKTGLILFASLEKNMIRTSLAEDWTQAPTHPKTFLSSGKITAPLGPLLYHKKELGIIRLGKKALYCYPAIVVVRFCHKVIQAQDRT